MSLTLYPSTYRKRRPPLQQHLIQPGVLPLRDRRAREVEEDHENQSDRAATPREYGEPSRHDGLRAAL